MGARQKVIVTHDPNEIDQEQLLMVKVLKLDGLDAIIPGTANLSFNIEFSSTADPERMLVSNIGGVIIKKLAVKFQGNEILGVDDFNMFSCYQDLWKTESEKWNTVRQGIIYSRGCTENCMTL